MDVKEILKHVDHTLLTQTMEPLLYVFRLLM